METSSARFKPNIPKAKSEWIWDIMGYSFYVGSLLFLIIIWPKLSGEVPAHYDAFGEVDRWGSRWELLIFPGIGALILVIMQTLELFPESYNQPKRLNESNVKQFYTIGRKAVNQLKNSVLIIFALVLFNDVSVALGWVDGFNILFLPLVIIGLGVPIALAIMRYKKVK